MPNTIVQAQIDEKTRAEAAAVLEQNGLSIADAIERTLQRIALDKHIPSYIAQEFDNDVGCPYSHEPNALTAEAIRQGRRGENIYVAQDEDDLFRHLGLGDA